MFLPVLRPLSRWRQSGPSICALSPGPLIGQGPSWKVPNLKFAERAHCLSLGQSHGFIQRSSTAAAFVSNGPAIDPEWGICPSEIGVQYQPDGRLSGKLLIVPHSHTTSAQKYLTISASQIQGTRRTDRVGQGYSGTRRSPSTTRERTPSYGGTGAAADRPGVNTLARIASASLSRE